MDGVITSWDQGAEQMFGYSAAEAIGQHITLIIAPDRHAEEDDSPRVPTNQATLEARLFIQVGFLLVYFLSAVATGWIFHLYSGVHRIS